MQRPILYVLVAIAGGAALAWQVIWALLSSQALGHGSTGAAITLAGTMGGMGLGALVSGRALRRGIHPGLAFGVLEIAIGVFGFASQPGFDAVAWLDAAAYRAWPPLAPFVGLLGLAAVIGLPAGAMGATLPLLASLATLTRARLSAFYGVQILGASVGASAIAFGLLPALGVTASIRTLALLDLLVGASALVALRSLRPPAAGFPRTRTGPGRHTFLLVALSGFSTFVLEVAWFRSLRTAFNSTTEGFAIMLSSFLAALAIGASLAPVMKRRGVTLDRIVFAAGCFALVSTPVIERYPSFIPYDGPYYGFLVPMWFWQCLSFCGPAVACIGMVLPWLLDDAPSPQAAGTLYAVNTLGAVTGSLLAGWILLPALGVAGASWIAGGCLLVVGSLLLSPRDQRWAPLFVAACVIVAVVARPSPTTQVALGFRNKQSGHVLVREETPDTTLAVIEIPKHRMLAIDGFVASGDKQSSHYRTWMGRLPMILHPDPREALVIAFGTGQTAHAVRSEGATRLDVVDLDRAVFELAPYFPANHDVLLDPVVRTIPMDGRAWLRRSSDTYDVITMEPMAPFQAGVNGLYSVDFYALARSRLQDGGLIAQWLPFHLVHSSAAKSIVTAFTSVFPNAMMWIDPYDQTAILLGTTAEEPIGTRWPGFQRLVDRDMDASLIRRAILLTSSDLDVYAGDATPVSDDNQLLAYGRLPSELVWHAYIVWDNLKELQRFY